MTSQAHPSQAHRAALAEVIKRDLEYRIHHKIEYLFPDDGPLRRELYTQAMEFFGNGSKNVERAYIAGNRCLTPWQEIQTDNATVQMREALFSTDLHVRSWDGETLCSRRSSPAFLRGIEEAFLLVLDNGLTLQCSGRHQLLTRGESSTHQDVYRDLAQIVRDSSGYRCRRISQGSIPSCGKDNCLYDEQLRLRPGIALDQLPSLADALLQALVGSPVDGEARKSECSRAYLESYLHSIQDAPHQIAVLCDLFADPTSQLDVLLPNTSIQTLRQSLAESDLRQEASVVHLGQSESFEIDPFQESLSLESLDSLSVLFPFNTPYLCSGSSFIEGNRILAIISLGLQPILDITVEGTHNYVAAGVINHNCGKTFTGAYETVCHLTGIYPPWWDSVGGFRFDKPTDCWIAGMTAKDVRDITQKELMGDFTNPGTGMIPKHLIVDTVNHRGIPQGFEKIFVKHVSGGVSELAFKSFDQGSESFYGTKKDFIWLDELPPQEIYNECKMRLTPTTLGQLFGRLFVTATPLQGWTPLVTRMLKPDDGEGKVKIAVTYCRWDQVPHLSADTIKELEGTYLPHELQVRRSGMPSVGAGAVYPVPQSQFVIEPVKLQDFWRFAYGMDVGANTAAIFGAYDADADIIYIYDEYLGKNEAPSTNASAIKRKAQGATGIVDPASNQTSQTDGEKLIQIYRGEGLKLINADNAVEAGIMKVYERLITGRLKVFSCCHGLIQEMAVYTRDAQGKIVKKNDHRCDALRYLLSKMGFAAKSRMELGSQVGGKKVVDTSKYTNNWGALW